MSEINDECLEVFPAWLGSLSDDVQTILAVLKSDRLDPESRRFLTGGINYLFKSLDLIPDGIDDIGYLDDAFVLRFSAKAALEGEVGSLDEESLKGLRRLASETDLVEKFLEKDVCDRLEAYTRGLTKGAARGRTVDEIIESPAVFKEFTAEIDGFVEQYNAPGFSKDEKNLIKLKAFLGAKLPK
ncbi:MAG: DUF1232 domain-containing protein [Proteobacteria bacterium]|nr:DUF1232 domain-containing protein [Pseudomonadota bacterium]